MTKDKFERKIKRRKRFIYYCLLFIFVGALLSLGLRSDFFSIKNIVVRGNSFVSKEEILALCGVQGENIFLIKKDRIKEKIFENPYIENVQIKRKIPSTVIVYIKEKEVKGLVRFENSFINLDKDGRMIQIVNQFPNGSIPLIEGINVKQYLPGQSIAGSSKTLQDALKAVLTVTDYEECRNRFYSVNLFDPYSIIFTTKEGTQIKVGDWTNIDYKLSYAMTILNNPSVKGSKGYIEIQPEGTAVFKKN